MSSNRADTTLHGSVTHAGHTQSDTGHSVLGHVLSGLLLLLYQSVAKTATRTHPTTAITTASIDRRQNTF
eukprot:693256-Prorocentrum_minimum.AAC.10